MIRIFKAISFFTLLIAGAGGAFAADCADDPKTTGISRTIAIDASGRKEFGRLQYKKTAPVRKGELILTFDDGPHSKYTQQILKTLDKHCIKVTFFTVGRMALYGGSILKIISDKGHTLATHTWSHPRDLSKMPVEEAKIEIEKGFVATSSALGHPIAPFFRYPGLNDSPELNAYMASRGISVWSVDVVTDDTRRDMTPELFVNQTLERVRKMGRGIVLFHDLKQITADNLDLIISQLKYEGFKFVHVVSNSSYQPNPDLIAQLDINKQSLHNVAFTGVTPEGFAPDEIDSDQILRTGKVDIMKSEFVNIDAEGISEKHEVAASETAKTQ